MENKTQMTKIEIIDELITNGYAKDPSTRAFNLTAGGREICVYRTDEGKRCAVGKCINNLHIKEFETFEGDVYDMEEYLSDEGDRALELDRILFEKYRGHDIYFWSKLQSFHDSKDHFTETGLSEYGELCLLRLKEQFG